LRLIIITQTNEALVLRDDSDHLVPGFAVGLMA